MKYLDIHTHTVKKTDSVLNVFIQNLNVSQKYTGKISSGLHPWHINNINIEFELTKLEQYAEKGFLTAIGETGLDKISETDYELQKEVFLKHIYIAEKYSFPLIIHCVKSYNEIIEIKKKIKPVNPWIFHGFNKNSLIAKELIKHNCFLSFGEAILRNNSKTNESLKEIPLDRVFFETDESESEIKEIYETASKILNIGTDKLRLKIAENFNRCFEKGI